MPLHIATVPLSNFVTHSMPGIGIEIVVTFERVFARKYFKKLPENATPVNLNLVGQAMPTAV